MPPGEPIPGETYRADGWQYIDMPARLSFGMKDKLFGIIGEGNVVTLAETIGPDFWRGQILVSPDGQARLLAYAEGSPQ